jgi:hypothetical protein
VARTHLLAEHSWASARVRAGRSECGSEGGGATAAVRAGPRGASGLALPCQLPGTRTVPFCVRGGERRAA